MVVKSALMPAFGTSKLCAKEIETILNPMEPSPDETMGEEEKEEEKEED